MEYKYEYHNIDGQGDVKRRVYHVGVRPGAMDYWGSVTDIPCPVCESGNIQWAEAGYVPGYRVCNKCHRHFLAGGNSEDPKLITTGRRRKYGR